MAYQQQIQKLEAEAKQRQKELEELRRKEEALKAGEPRAVAEFLHEKECHWNHTDGCGWLYETWEGASGDSSTRASWLRKAERLVEYATKNGVPINIALEIRTIN